MRIWRWFEPLSLRQPLASGRSARLAAALKACVLVSRSSEHKLLRRPDDQATRRRADAAELPKTEDRAHCPLTYRIRQNRPRFARLAEGCSLLEGTSAIATGSFCPKPIAPRRLISARFPGIPSVGSSCRSTVMWTLPAARPFVRADFELPVEAFLPPPGSYRTRSQGFAEAEYSPSLQRLRHFRRSLRVFAVNLFRESR